MLGWFNLFEQTYFNDDGSSYLDSEKQKTIRFSPSGSSIKLIEGLVERYKSNGEGPLRALQFLSAGGSLKFGGRQIVGTSDVNRYKTRANGISVHSSQ